jgi:crotonobetainyl-CoA:carnitine CoA-transferase CaiB-like acyl-CoA transferase
LTGPAGPSPRLGEHTRTVLQGILGLSNAEIDSMKELNII